MRQDPAWLGRLPDEADPIQQHHRLLAVEAPRRAEEVMMTPVMRQERRLDILERGEAAEYAGDLKRAGEPPAAEVLGRQAADVLASKKDLPGVVSEIAGDQVEERRLAGAVGADDRAQVALGDGQVHAAHGLDAAEMLAQADGLED